MENQTHLRKELLNYLQKAHTHVSLEDAVKNFPLKMINQKAPKCPYTFWALLEHIGLTQNDMLEFVKSKDYQDKQWPEGYWPKKGYLAKKADWDKTLAGYKKDLAEFKKIVANEKLDLLKKIPHGNGQTIFREILQVIDHCSYHIGEFVLMRRMMNIWKE